MREDESKSKFQQKLKDALEKGYVESRENKMQAFENPPPPPPRKDMSKEEIDEYAKRIIGYCSPRRDNSIDFIKRDLKDFRNSCFYKFESKCVEDYKQQLIKRIEEEISEWEEGITLTPLNTPWVEMAKEKIETFHRAIELIETIKPE
jgi:hypothetical protein